MGRCVCKYSRRTLTIHSSRRSILMLLNSGTRNSQMQPDPLNIHIDLAALQTTYFRRLQQQLDVIKVLQICCERVMAEQVAEHGWFCTFVPANGAQLKHDETKAEEAQELNFKIDERVRLQAHELYDTIITLWRVGLTTTDVIEGYGRSLEYSFFRRRARPNLLINLAPFGRCTLRVKALTKRKNFCNLPFREYHAPRTIPKTTPSLVRHPRSQGFTLATRHHSIQGLGFGDHVAADASCQRNWLFPALHGTLPNRAQSGRCRT